MKPGMTVITKIQVREQWIWLCESIGEWATYVSSESDPKTTVIGRYFTDYGSAVADFDARLRLYFPVPEPVKSENGWTATFEARRGIQSGGIDIYLLCSLADGTTDYKIYNDQYDDIWQVRDRLTEMDGDTFVADLVLSGKPISIKLYKACDWSWWAFFEGKHKKLNISSSTNVYDAIHIITEIDGDHLFHRR